MDALARPPWLAAVATAGGYLVLLALMAVLLFVLPYLVFVAL